MGLAKVAAPASLAVVAVIVAAAAAVSFVFEHATVTISVPQTPIEARSTLLGSPTGGDFATQLLQVTATETMAGVATGKASNPGQFASGFVVFGHYCAPLPGQNVCQPVYPVPAGTVIWNNQGTMTYVLESGVTCFCGESVAVHAWSRGSFGNAAAHTVSLYTRPNGFTYFETADNPRPIAGGVDPSSWPVVTKADADAVSTRLTAQLTTDLSAAMAEKAGSLHYKADAPVIATVGGSPIGQAKTTFQITASGSLSATAFSDTDARSLVLKGLSNRIPTDQRLASSVSIKDYAVTFSDVPGNVTVTGTARAYSIPRVDTGSLPPRLRGLDPKAAAKLVKTVAPVSSVTIQMMPFSMPWLPLNSGHISVVVLPGSA